ncbi:Protein HflK [Gammaproteobacteria bacterium]
MAWKEPGDGKKDPWTGKGTDDSGWSGRGNRGGPDQGPPELDEILERLRAGLDRVMKGDRGSPRPPQGDWPLRSAWRGLGWLLSLALIYHMYYTVEPAERAVVLRFGAFTRITEPGPHFRWPWPIEEITKVNVDDVKTFRHKAQMLTKDENIVDIELTIQYRAEDPKDLLYSDIDPEKTLREATEAVVRESIGKNGLDFIMTEGRGAISDSVLQKLQELMRLYRTGLLVTSVNMQPAKPPEQVKSAFDDAIKAREDKERLENEAQAYSNEVLPKARGAAARIVADAKGYRDKVVADAEGETSRFSAVLAQYLLAPEVTRERLYLDAIESILGRSGKVLVDTQGNNNLLYLPLDKWMDRLGARSPSPEATAEAKASEREAMPPLRDDSRTRSSRP